MYKKVRGPAALIVIVIALAAGCTIPGGGGGTPNPGGGGGNVMHKRVTYPLVQVPAAQGTDMGMKNAGVSIGAQKPCTNCYITKFTAGLVDTSGQQVNVDKGYWLHHMVLANLNPQQGAGLACGMEGFFTSGNERITVDLSKSGNYGYPVRATDQWSLIEELANITNTPKSMSVTVDFDYVPMGAAAGLKPAKPLWIGAYQCMGAYIPSQAGKHDYSWTWTSTVNAKIIYAHMHMHDGATGGTFAKNGQTYCESEQLYGTKPESIEGPGMTMPGMAHISEVKQCQGTGTAPITTIKRGDRLTQTAHYDSNAHMLMGTEPNMGIGHAWIDLS